MLKSKTLKKYALTCVISAIVLIALQLYGITSLSWPVILALILVLPLLWMLGIIGLFLSVMFVLGLLVYAFYDEDQL